MFDSRSLARAGFAGTTWAESCRRIVDELPEVVYILSLIHI